MKKIVFLWFFAVLLFSYAEAQNFEKVTKPDFFVPDTIDFDAPEKIPTSRIRKTTSLQKSEKNDLKDNNLDKTNNVPFYKFKYDEYINDIMVFYSSGVMPRNVLLEKDLAEMNSNEPMEADFAAPTELTSQEMRDFYELYQRLLNN